MGPPPHACHSYAGEARLLTTTATELQTLVQAGPHSTAGGLHPAPEPMRPIRHSQEELQVERHEAEAIMSVLGLPSSLGAARRTLTDAPTSNEQSINETAPPEDTRGAGEAAVRERPRPSPVDCGAAAVCTPNRSQPVLAEPPAPSESRSSIESTEVQAGLAAAIGGLFLLVLLVAAVLRYRARARRAQQQHDAEGTPAERSAFRLFRKPKSALSTGSVLGGKTRKEPDGPQDTAHDTAELAAAHHDADNVNSTTQRSSSDDTADRNGPTEGPSEPVELVVGESFSMSRAHTLVASCQLSEEMTSTELTYTPSLSRSPLNPLVSQPGCSPPLPPLTPLLPNPNPPGAIPAPASVSGSGSSPRNPTGDTGRTQFFDTGPPPEGLEGSQEDVDVGGGAVDFNALAAEMQGQSKGSPMPSSALNDDYEYVLPANLKLMNTGGSDDDSGSRRPSLDTALERKILRRLDRHLAKQAARKAAIAKRCEELAARRAQSETNLTHPRIPPGRDAKHTAETTSPSHHDDGQENGLREAS